MDGIVCWENFFTKSLQPTRRWSSVDHPMVEGQTEGHSQADGKTSVVNDWLFDDTTDSKNSRLREVEYRCESVDAKHA
jgi:hypothetical protein